MKLTTLEIPDLLLIEPEWHVDPRGAFARTFCARELAAVGVNLTIAQCNLSRNARTGTLRGMHYQDVPEPEQKLVTCIAGSIFDVALDLRPDSPTYLEWCGVELSAANARALYIPAGVAHGFQTLEDDSTVHYTMGEYYAPELQRGVRWNDSVFGICWPQEAAVMSERDAAFADFEP